MHPHPTSPSRGRRPSAAHGQRGELDLPLSLLQGEVGWGQSAYRSTSTTLTSLANCRSRSQI
jgi:hypothetical protein